MDQITQAFRSFSCKNKLIALGDFNAPDIDWSTLSASSTNLQILCDIVFPPQHQLNDNHAYSQQGPDLLLTNMDHPIHHIHIDISSSAILSDHYPITFDLVTRSASLKSSSHLLYDYDKANFDGLNDYLSDLNYSACYNSVLPHVITLLVLLA